MRGLAPQNPTAPGVIRVPFMEHRVYPKSRISKEVMQ